MSQITFFNGFGPVPPGAVLRVNTPAGFATPDAGGIINLNPGANIITRGNNAHSLSVEVTDSIYLPATEGPDGTGLSKGVYGIEDTRVLHTMGGLALRNVFVGFRAGNLNAGLVGEGNTSCGTQSLALLTSGNGNCAFGASSLSTNDVGFNNCAYGDGSLAANIDGENNCAYGHLSLFSNSSGSRNISIGSASSFDMDIDANDNIVIGNRGNTGINNTIIIGDSASQDANYQAGIYQKTVGTTNENVVIDSVGKLGTSGPVCGSYGFLATIDADLPANLAPHFGYFLGRGVFALTPKYDNSLGAFYIGDAILEASYTAPITGLYSFTYNLVLHNVKVTNSTNCWMLLGTGIVGQPGAFASWSPYYMGAGNQIGSANQATLRGMYSFTQQIYLTIGQQVLFRFFPYAANMGSETADLGLGQYTSISGYLVHT